MDWSLDCDFHGKKQVRQDKQAWDWQVEKFQQALGRGPVPNCLVPGPGVTRAR